MDPKRSAKTRHELRDDAPSRTDQKIDAVHQVIETQLAPRIATMSKNAVLSDRREFYYYQKKNSGRRCSCFLSQASPQSQCPICFGQGVVGGYEKYGTKTEIIDFTAPDLVMVNVEPNLNEATTPVYLRLKDGYDAGYIEATIPIMANICEMDTYFLSQPLYNRGIKIFIMDNGQAVPIIKAEDFDVYLGGSSMRVRLEFQKLDAKPLITHFMMRYKLQKDLLVYGDVARSSEFLQSSQFGLMDIYEEIPIFFDGRRISTYKNEDLLFRVIDQRKFKIVSISENVVASVNTSYDVRARYIMPNVDTGLATFLY